MHELAMENGKRSSTIRVIRLAGLVLLFGLLSASHGHSVGALHSGPWGQLSTAEIELDPPASLFGQGHCTTRFSPWFFRGHTQDTLARLFTAAGLGPVQQARMLGAASCQPGGCVIQPDLEMV